MAKKYTVRDNAGATLFAGAGDDVAFELAPVNNALTEFKFSEGFTALARAKGKAVDRVLKDLAEGASLGLTLAHVKGQARAKIIGALEQGDILRLAKMVQSGLYDSPIQSICKSYNVAFTVFSEPGRGVSRSEWVKFGLTLKFAGEEKTPKGNPTPRARANIAAYERLCLIQETAEALREAVAA